MQLRALQQKLPVQCHLAMLFEEQQKFSLPTDPVPLCRTLSVRTKLGNQSRKKTHQNAKCIHLTCRSLWGTSKTETSWSLYLILFSCISLITDWTVDHPKAPWGQTHMWRQQRNIDLSFCWCILARANRIPRGLAYMNPNTFYLGVNVPYSLLLWSSEYCKPPFNSQSTS